MRDIHGVVTYTQTDSPEASTDGLGAESDVHGVVTYAADGRESLQKAKLKFIRARATQWDRRTDRQTDRRTVALLNARARGHNVALDRQTDGQTDIRTDK